jgi:hypothetical protein
MKTCDKNLAADTSVQLCGEPATVSSSRRTRHRCGSHHEGPGWVPYDAKVAPPPPLPPREVKAKRSTEKKAA